MYKVTYYDGKDSREVMVAADNAAHAKKVFESSTYAFGSVFVKAEKVKK